MNKKNFIVDSPFTPIEILVNNKIVELSCFSISRGRQTGKAQYCLGRTKDNLRLTFQVCNWFKIFSLSMTTFGLIITLLPVLLGRLHWDGMGILMICGFLFSISGIMILINTKKVVFDSHINEFGYTNTIFNKGFTIKLDTIIGMQVIESMEKAGSSIDNDSNWKRKFYELNIIFENMERINLVKMTNLEAVNNISNELGYFLQKPLWWIEIIYNKKQKSATIHNR